MAKLSVIIDAAQAVRGSRQAVTAIQNINIAVNTTTKGITEMERRSTRMARTIAAASRVAVRAFQSIGRSVRRVGQIMAAVKSSILSFGTIISGLAAGLLVTKVIQYADAWQNARNRLAAFTDTAQQATAIQERLFRISQQTRTSFAETANLFSRLLVNRDQTGASASELLEFTRIIGQTIQLSGSTTAEASGALRQLSQLLSAENVRSAGQELASIGEQASFTFKILADGLGVTTAEVRRLAQEGKLTSSAIIRGVISVSGEVDDRFGKIIPSIGSAFTALNNAIQRTVGLISQATGFGERFATTLLSIAATVSDIGTIASNPGFAIGNVNAKGGSAADVFISDFANETVGKTFVDILIDQVKFRFVPAFGQALAGVALVFASYVVLAITRVLPQIFTLIGIVADAFAQAITDALRRQSKFIDKILGEKNNAGLDISTIGQQLDAVGVATGKAGLEQIAAAGSKVAESFSDISDFARASAESILAARDSSVEFGETTAENVKKLTLFGKLFEGVSTSARQVGENIGQAFGDAFSNIITGVESVRDAFANLAQQIFQMLFQAIVTSRLQSVFGNLLSGLAGGATGGGGSPAVPSAMGNAFMGGNVVPFAQGGIIDRMGIFPLSGGKIGVAGEAGDEAMMEVARLPGGKLGVARRGGNGGNVYNINVSVRANDPSQFGGSSRQMRRSVDRALRGVGNSRK